MELTEACGCTAIQQFNFSFSPAFFPVLKSISHWLCACQSPPSLLLSVKNWRVWNLYLKASKLICHRLIDSGRRHKTPRSKTECSYLWPSGQQELHVHRDVSCSPNPTGWYRTQTGLHHSQRTLSLGNPIFYFIIYEYNQRLSCLFLKFWMKLLDFFYFYFILEHSLLTMLCCHRLWREKKGNPIF